MARYFPPLDDVWRLTQRGDLDGVDTYVFQKAAPERPDSDFMPRKDGKPVRKFRTHAVPVEKFWKS